jgi:hypothetical protein
MTNRTIRHVGEYWTLNDKGQIGRPNRVMPSDSWHVTGACVYNNFGHVIEFYSLAQILADPNAIPWKHKNGKQKTFVRDFDHGTMREWRNSHSIF